jgi:hypothetical protein
VVQVPRMKKRKQPCFYLHRQTPPYPGDRSYDHHHPSLTSLLIRAQTRLPSLRPIPLPIQRTRRASVSNEANRSLDPNLDNGILDPSQNSFMIVSTSISPKSISISPLSKIQHRHLRHLENRPVQRLLVDQVCLLLPCILRERQRRTSRIQ